MTARQKFSFPPENAEFLIRRWKELGCPEIPLDRSHPGYIVTDLERFFNPAFNIPGEWIFEHVLEIQTWLLDGKHEEVLETIKKVRNFLPEDAIVVPGHGTPIKPKDIEFVIRYLETLHKEAKRAVEKGLTLEQAQKSIAMKDFQGYALWGWVHTQLNVSATYKDLSK